MNAEMNTASGTAWGLQIVGNEILCGARRDRHMDHFISVLEAHGQSLAWCRFEGDSLEQLVPALRRSRADGVRVICVGGIGATPDDQTRQAAARAFQRPLQRHPEAVALLEDRFGAEAYPIRIRMAELPAGAQLIANPVNRIPGFSVENHYFLPGFPQMAWPMFDALLETQLQQTSEPAVQRSARVFDTPESELVPLLEELDENYPQARLFSLPHLGQTAWVEVGFRGDRASVESAFLALLGALDRGQIPFSCD